MQAWRGWTTTSAPAITAAPTWDGWRAFQRRLLRRAQPAVGPTEESCPFSARELARLSFARWLYQRGRLDPAVQPLLEAK
jgi:hypothetical protein